MINRIFVPVDVYDKIREQFDRNGKVIIEAQCREQLLLRDGR